MLRLRPGDAYPAAWLVTHLRVVQLPPAKKTHVFLVDPTSPACPDDPRKKTRCVKLCKILDADLSILAETGHAALAQLVRVSR